MNAREHLISLNLPTDIQEIALRVLTLLEINGFVGRSEYDGLKASIFASEPCLWFAGGDSRINADFRVELRILREELYVAFYYEKRSGYVCMKYADARWFCYATETDASQRLVGMIKNWSTECRSKNLDPVWIISKQKDALSPIVLDIIQSSIPRMK